jgi:hypothetical protein
MWIQLIYFYILHTYRHLYALNDTRLILVENAEKVPNWLNLSTIPVPEPVRFPRRHFVLLTKRKTTAA